VSACQHASNVRSQLIVDIRFATSAPGGPRFPAPVSTCQQWSGACQQRVGFEAFGRVPASRRIRKGRHYVGHDYARLRAALEWRTHTAVRTNIRADGKKKFASFHWLGGWKEVVDVATGEPTGMTMTLPDWLFDGIVMKGGVLTIHEDYFLLTGGVGRWLYRVVRKHAGNQQSGWQFTMRQLYEKSGASSRFSDFAIDVRRVVEEDTLPQYALMIHKNEEGDEIVQFIPRDQFKTNDPRFQSSRHPRRRVARGITSKGSTFNKTAA
jgi:plasmid replication initiation protein